MSLGQYNHFLYNPNGFYNCLSPPPITTLVYTEGRGPGIGKLNTNFGWDSNGVWFSGNAGNPAPSYPVFTNFNMKNNDRTEVIVDFTHGTLCSDFGICFYPVNTIPNWDWDVNSSRIAIQNNCNKLDIFGLNGLEKIQVNPAGLIIGNTYTVRVIYDPTNPSYDSISYQVFYGPSLINTVSLNLPTKLNSNYKIGFSADRDTSTPGKTNATYMKNLTIIVNNFIAYKNNLINTSIPHV